MFLITLHFSMILWILLTFSFVHKVGQFATFAIVYTISWGSFCIIVICTTAKTRTPILQSKICVTFQFGASFAFPYSISSNVITSINNATSWVCDLSAHCSVAAAITKTANTFKGKIYIRNMYDQYCSLLRNVTQLRDIRCYIKVQQFIKSIHDELLLKLPFIGKLSKCLCWPFTS